MSPTPPMDVQRFGVDPARLRKFLREMSASKQSFTTPEAMDALGLGEPEGSRALAAMGEARWLVYLGTDNRIDCWKIGRLGIQFSMKRFLKRIPVDKANALLERAIDAARTFNMTNVSTRITRLTLFGSLARGGDDQGTVGDIDLQLTICRREDISEDEHAALVAAEANQAPKRLAFEFGVRKRADDAGLRHLRAVGNYLSVSTHDNIGDMGCEHRIVYQFDARTGAEIPSDRSLVPADKAKQAAFNTDVEHNAPLPLVPDFRPWPVAPPRRPTGLVSRRPAVDRSLAQYLWQRGESLKDIARGQNVKETDVQAVLAQSGIALPDAASIRMTASPLDALAPLLMGFPTTSANVQLGNFGSYGTVIVHLYRGRHEAACSASPTHAEPEGDPELAPLAEVIARAGALWHKRFRSKTPKIELSMQFDLRGAPQGISEEASTMRQASKCAKAFNCRFDELFETAKFESIYETRRIKSLRLILDLLRLELCRWRRNGSKLQLALGDLAEPARALASALIGDHSGTITMISLTRHQSQWDSEQSEPRGR